MRSEGNADVTGKSEWTYEPPVVEDLGSLEEITQKGGTAGPDGTMTSTQ
jgi:hypothetical protein